MRKGYFKIPSKATFLELPGQALGLYVFLASLEEEFNPSIRFLARKLKMAKISISRNLDLLASRNLIRLISHGDLKEPNKYEFVNPKEWK